ncbi:MAG TPA: hypothetical protein VFF66_05565 [Brevundimonas sp.]|nr:hypothetical protein [Brevundimonas sp.]
MTVTYPHDRPLPPNGEVEPVREEPFVPVYARTRKTRGRKGGVKTWMILAPLGVLVLGAGAAAMMMGGEDATPAPLAEPAATAPVLPAQPLLTEVAPIEAAPVAEATPAPAPVVRRTAPAPARRAAPARTAPADPAPTPRVEVAPTSPEPYTASLNAAPTPARTEPPLIVIKPAG